MNDKIKEEFEKSLIDETCIKEAMEFQNTLKENVVIGFGFALCYKSRDEELEKWRIRNDKQEARIIDQDVEIKNFRDKVNKAYKLITSQKTCIEWNEGFDILRDIIKDGE